MSTISATRASGRFMTKRVSGIRFTMPATRWAFLQGPGSHGMPLVSREAVYEWMIRWLNHSQGDFHEQLVRCTPAASCSDRKRPC